MKRIVIIALVCVFLLCGVFACAQSTTTSATITDSDGFAWMNGSYRISFAPNPQWPNPQSYVWTGGNLQQNNLFTGSLDASGAFSVSLPDNNQITPSGSKWNFSICPLATSGCFAVTWLVTGSSVNLTSLLSASASGPRFAANPNAYGYGTIEVSPSPKPGAIFMNTTTNVSLSWDGVSWIQGSLPIGFSCSGSPITCTITGNLNVTGTLADKATVSTSPSSISINQQALNFQSAVSAIENPRLAGGSRSAVVCAAPADSWSSFHWTLYSALFMGETWGSGGPGWTNTTGYGAGYGNYPINGVSVTLTGSWTVLDGNAGQSPVGPDLTAAKSAGTGGTIIWAFPQSPAFPSDLPWGSSVSEVDLFWWGQPGGGSFTYTDGSGGPHTINTASYTGLQITKITGFNLAAFSNSETVTVTAAGTNGVIIFGTNGLNGKYGTILHDLGHSGSTTGAWAGANAATMEAAWMALGCSTYVNMLGINDANAAVSTATYLSNSQALVAEELASNPAADIVFVSEPDNGGGISSTLLSYKNSVQPWLLSSNYVWGDLYDLWGPYAGPGGTYAQGFFLNNNHPNPNGDVNIAKFIDGLLTKGLVGYSDNVPSLASSASILPVNISGNAGTSSAFQSAPGQCGTNLFSTGVTAYGTANCADPVNPTGTIFKNLVPDSSLKLEGSGTGTYWTFGTAPGANFSIGNKLGYGDTNAFVVSSAASGQSQWAQTETFNLICGQTYTMSGYLDGTYASGNNFGWSLQNPSRTVHYEDLNMTPPNKLLVAGTFTFSPAACTVGAAYPSILLAATTGTTIAAGKTILFSAPMIVAGSTPVAYVENIGDDDSGTLIGSTIYPGTTGQIPYYAANGTTVSTAPGISTDGTGNFSVTGTVAATNGVVAQNLPASASSTVLASTQFSSFPGICSLSGGNLYAVWRLAPAHAISYGTSIMASTGTLQANNTFTWSTPAVIATNASYDSRDPNCVQLSNGHIMLTYMLVDLSSIGQAQSRISTDLGATWSSDSAIGNFAYENAVTAPGVPLGDGSVVVPLYGRDTSANNFIHRIFRTTNEGTSWAVRGNIDTSTAGATEVTMIKLNNGNLEAFLRDWPTVNNIATSTSSDGGVTWTTAAAQFTGTGRPNGYQFPDGKIMVGYRSAATVSSFAGGWPSLRITPNPNSSGWSAEMIQSTNIFDYSGFVFLTGGTVGQILAIDSGGVASTFFGMLTETSTFSPVVGLTAYGGTFLYDVNLYKNLNLIGANGVSQNEVPGGLTFDINEIGGNSYAWNIINNPLDSSAAYYSFRTNSSPIFDIHPNSGTVVLRGNTWTWTGPVGLDDFFSVYQPDGYGTDLWTKNSNDNTYLDNTYNNAASAIWLRTRTSGTPKTGLVIQGGAATLPTYTVAGSPNCGTGENPEGQIIGVTNALNPTAGSAFVGGGSTHIAGYCNGTIFVPLGAANISGNAATATALVPQAADTTVMNATGGSAAPTAVAMPTCTTGADLYNTSTHAWSCVSVSSPSGPITANAANALYEYEATGVSLLSTGLTSIFTTASGYGRFHPIRAEIEVTSTTGSAATGNLVAKIGTSGQSYGDVVYPLSTTAANIGIGTGSGNIAVGTTLPLLPQFNLSTGALYGTNSVAANTAVSLDITTALATASTLVATVRVWGYYE